MLGRFLHKVLHCKWDPWSLEPCGQRCSLQNFTGWLTVIIIHNFQWRTLILVALKGKPMLYKSALIAGHSSPTLREFQSGCLWLFHSWNRSTAQCFSCVRSIGPYSKGFKPWEKRPVWGRPPASLCPFRVRSNSAR